jgi:hypothetical protein
MTAFFIPGVSGATSVVEDAYDGMRRQVELEMGRAPTSRRISTLWTRRGSLDCITEVGKTDPLLGGTVLAIFDMGRHQPYVVWCEQDAARRDGTREVLGNNAYSVSEFDT